MQRPIAERDPSPARSRRLKLLSLLFILTIVCQAATAAQESTLVHIVQPGETLWAIGRQYGLSAETLALVNELDDPNSLKVGQKLLISATQSVDYTVQRGDSLWGIATAFGVSVNDIVAANGISDPSMIRVGQSLRIPLGIGGVASIRPYIEHKIVRGDTLWEIADTYGVRLSAITAANPGVDASRLKIGDVIKVPIDSYSPGRSSASTPKYILPVSGGRVTSQYGWRTDPFTGQKTFHGGVDIGLPEGTPIYASAAGVVIEAGIKGGYGYTVMIQHDDGFVTLYGHASKLLVKEGQRVAQGQLIARVGSTGRATGPHLHFEVRKGEATVDPNSLVTIGK